MPTLHRIMRAMMAKRIVTMHLHTISPFAGRVDGVLH